MNHRATALARLAVDAGAHVSPGQTVVVSAALGQEALAREIAAASYDRGAHQVQVDYMDPHVRRARLERAPEAALGEVIPWVRQRPGQMAEMQRRLDRAERPVGSGLLDDLDPGRIGRDTVALVEWAEVIDRGEVSWTIVPGPNEAWARLLFGDVRARSAGGAVGADRDRLPAGRARSRGRLVAAFRRTASRRRTG